MGILNKKSKKTENAAAETPKRAPRAAKKDEAVETAQTKGAVPTSAAVLLRPYLSEKVAMQEANGVYTFVVANNATKVEVKQAVQSLYGVAPASVRIMQYEGKNVRFGRTMGKRSDWKKAVVTLPKGKTISVHTGV